jgi:hypothetical protein
MTDQLKPKTNDEVSPTQLRFLTPDMCRIHLGTHEALHVTVKNERIYGGVYAAYAFPVAHPDEYISLIHVGGDEEMEIGIIRNLNEFPPEDAALVRQALTRRYFIHTITRIHDVGWKYGFINMIVDTDKGPADFLMPWRHDRAFDYGRRGKILIDVDDNRYLIPDLDRLSARELNEFQRYIYW